METYDIHFSIHKKIVQGKIKFETKICKNIMTVILMRKVVGICFNKMSLMEIFNVKFKVRSTYF